MATKPKESSSVVKEKKVPPSSSSHTTPTRSITKLASTSSSSTPKPSSNSTEKPIPNYLKPTISSRHDEAFKPIKKADHDPNQKAALNRRRSFDKPPSSSRVQSALVSPGPKERTAVRSSSFSSKTTTTSSSSSSKSISDNKPLRNPKPAKPQPTFTKSVKSTVLKKEASNVSASNRIPKSPPDHQSQTVVQNVEVKQEAAEYLVQEVEEVDSEVKVCPQEPKPEDNDQHSGAVDGEVNTDDENESKKACEEVKADIPDAGLEEIDDKSLEEKQVHDNTHFDGEDDEDKKNDESSESHTEEGCVSEAKEDVDEGKVNETDVKEIKVDEENKNEGKIGDNNEKEEVACEGSNVDKEGKDVEEGKPEAEAEGSVKQQGGGQGKKDNIAPAYNDVIEETASKLLEKRKNKVKALVGAFETVIDYESK